MTNEEKLYQIFPDGICPFSKVWLSEEYREPTTKNNLGVDCIDRADAIKAMQNKAKELKNEDTINGLCGAVAILYEMPSVTPQLSVPEVTALAEWIEKLTKECEDAYNKGYADGMKAQDKNCSDCEIVQACVEAGIRSTSRALGILDKIRAEITEYGSIWVEYKITGRSDKDIEQLVSDVLKQAKEQVLDVIDKYKTETEDKE